MNVTPIDRKRIEEVVVESIRIINLAREPENRVAESNEAPLYGRDSPLDSLGLVALLMEVEEALRDQGLDVALSDERAMSRKQSPFRSVPMLVDYILEIAQAPLT